MKWYKHSRKKVIFLDKMETCNVKKAMIVLNLVYFYFRSVPNYHGVCLLESPTYWGSSCLWSFFSKESLQRRIYHFRRAVGVPKVSGEFQVLRKWHRIFKENTALKCWRRFLHLFGKFNTKRHQNPCVARRQHCFS